MRKLLGHTWVQVYLQWNSLFLIWVLELNADGYVSSLGINTMGKVDPVNQTMREKCCSFREEEKCLYWKKVGGVSFTTFKFLRKSKTFMLHREQIKLPLLCQSSYTTMLSSKSLWYLCKWLLAVILQVPRVNVEVIVVDGERLRTFGYARHKLLHFKEDAGLLADIKLLHGYVGWGNTIYIQKWGGVETK